MALVRTTLASALAADATKLVVASATSIAKGYQILVGNEVMKVTKAWVSGSVTVPVLRGQGGTYPLAHPVTAGVVHGDPTDSEWSNLGVQTASQFMIAGKGRLLTQISATGTLTLPPAGVDLNVELIGTTTIALTVPVPTKAHDWCRLHIGSNGAAAHTITFTGGLSGAGTSYDVLTVNATAPSSFEFVALNSLWMPICNAGMGGTLTNIIGSLA